MDEFPHSQPSVISFLQIQGHSHLADLLGDRVFDAGLPICLTVADWPAGTSHSDWLLAIFHRSKQADLPITVVSDKKWLTFQARALNIPVFETVESATQHLLRAKLPPADRQRNFPRTGPARMVRSSLPTHQSRNLSWFPLFSSAVLTMTVASVVLAFAVLVMPTATVTLHPPVQHLAITIPMSASLAVDQPENDIGLVPGRYVSTAQEISRTGPTSAKKYLPSEKSTGLILAVNQTQEPVTIPVGTEVQTGTGTAIRFVTMETVSVPGDTQTQQPIRIEAVEPGEIGNVPSNSITKIAGTFAFQLWITNPRPTFGGTSEFRHVVSQADIDLLQAQLLSEAESSALAILAHELNDSEWLPPATLNIDMQWTSTDFFVAEETEDLTMTMMVDLSGVAVDTSNMVEYVLGQLARQTPVGSMLLPASLALSLQPEPEWTGAQLSFAVSAAVDYVQEIRHDQIRKAIVGLTPEAAVAQLAPWSSGGTPEVELSPASQEVLPRLAQRIKILTHEPT